MPTTLRFSARAAAISSSGSAPRRSILYGAALISIIVDSFPRPHLPPSTTAAILPSKYPSTSCAVTGLFSPEGFAEGAANGRRAFFSIVCVIGWSGHLSATVSPPARTISGTMSFDFKTIVKGPGQNLSISTRACLGTFAQYLVTAAPLCSISDSGFTSGLPLTS